MHEQKYSYRAIAREIGLFRQTVKRYLDPNASVAGLLMDHMAHTVVDH